MTRLEKHRKSLLEEKRFGPLLRVEDLQVDEISLINSSFLELCRARKVSNIEETYSAYVDTLHQWGVICPHPLVHRRYDGFSRSDAPVPFETSKWYTCQLCRAMVINRE